MLTEMNATTEAPPSSDTRDETRVERGDFRRGVDETRLDGVDETHRASPARLVVATYNIRYAVGSHLIGGSLLRRAGLGWPSRRPRLVGQNIRKAAKLFSDGAAL